jgi:hypothetical protein
LRGVCRGGGSRVHAVGRDASMCARGGAPFKHRAGRGGCSTTSSSEQETLASSGPVDTIASCLAILKGCDEVGEAGGAS